MKNEKKNKPEPSNYQSRILLIIPPTVDYLWFQDANLANRNCSGKV